MKSSIRFEFVVFMIGLELLGSDKRFDLICSSFSSAIDLVLPLTEVFAASTAFSKIDLFGCIDFGTAYLRSETFITLDNPPDLR